MCELLAAALAVLDALPTTPEAIQAGDTAELTCLVEILEAHIATHRAELISVGDRKLGRSSVSSAVIGFVQDVRGLIPVMSNKLDGLAAKAAAKQIQAYRDNVRGKVEDEVRRLEEYLAARVPAEPPVGDTVPWPEYMSANDLADRLGLAREATRKKLERLSAKYDCRREVEGRRKGEAQYLYHVATVRPELP